MMPVSVGLMAVLAGSTTLQALTAAAQPAPLPAPPAPPKVAVISAPSWVKRPTAREVDRFYPHLAAREHLSGKTIMMCDVVADGSIANCEVRQETPPSLGFAEASLKMAPYFRMVDTLADGRSVAGAHVSIPIRWVAPDIDRGEAQRILLKDPYMAAFRKSSPDGWNALLDSLAPALNGGADVPRLRALANEYLAGRTTLTPVR